MPRNLTAAAQEKQFGYNNDYLGLYPLPHGSKGGDRFLLVVNHEYINPQTDVRRPRNERDASKTREQAEVEMAAHRRLGGRDRAARAANWKVVAGQQDTTAASRANTPMEISGPAAGHDRLKTTADPAGRKVLGMLNNCAGGMHAVGHLADLRGELQRLFRRRAAEPSAPKPRYKRYGIAGRGLWLGAQFDDRFDLAKEPNEPNRFGWVVEIDPYDPASHADEAHRARPLQARGRGTDASPRMAAWCSTPATTSASITSTSS